MAWLKINNFLGLNTKADPTNIDQHECQTCDSFDVSDTPGALIKRFGYADQAGGSLLPASYPASWTIKNFTFFHVTKPSAQDITVVHATVGGIDQIFVSHTYNGTQWVKAWVELTEKEESLTAEAGTTTDSVICSSLSSATNYYYNTWFILNIDMLAGAIVLDYNGGTTTLTLKTGVTGFTNGASFNLYRYPLVIQEEGFGFKANEGTNTTQIIDADLSVASTDIEDFFLLQDDFDDAYNGWIVENTTRSDTQEVSDYEANYAGTKQRLVLTGAISNQTDGDSYNIYKETRTFLVDDEIAFSQRPNTLIMTTGNTARFPKQFPLWYGYLRDTYYFGQADNDVTEGYYLEPTVLDAPNDLCLIDTTDVGSGDLEAGTFHFALAYEYDGYQLGALTSISRSEIKKVTSGSSENISVKIQIGYSREYNMAHSKTLNKRVTSVVLFASNDLDLVSRTGTFYRITSVPIREDYNFNYGGTKSHGNKQMHEHRPFSRRSPVSASARNIVTTGGRSVTRPQKIFYNNWTGSDPYTYIFTMSQDDWDNRGAYYSVFSGGLGGDRCNYKQVSDSLYHSVVGPVFVEQQENSVIGFSPLKFDGTPSQDWFPSLNVMDLSRHGIYSIIKHLFIGDFLYVFGSSKSLRLIMSAGLVPAFKVEREFDYLGTEAKFGLIKYQNNIVGVFENGVYVIGNTPNLISYKIEDPDQPPLNVTSIAEAITAMNGRRNEMNISFPSDQEMLVYNFLTKQWVRHSYAHRIVAMETDEDGKIFGASQTKIYRLDSATDDDGTNLNPSWKSKVYTMGDPQVEKILDEVEITYRSNTAIQFDVYINRGSAASWNTATDNQFAAATTTATDRKLFPATFRGYEIELGITIPTALRATNIYVEVYGINVKYHAEERID